MEDQPTTTAKMQKTTEDNDVSVITGDINNIATKMRVTSEEELCLDFARILDTYGVDAVKGWNSLDKHKHRLIHLLVNSNKQKVIKEFGCVLGINIPRESDKCMYILVDLFRFIFT